MAASDNTGPEAFFASLRDKTANLANGTTIDNGPEAFSSQLSLQLQQQDHHADLGCRHHGSAKCDCHHGHKDSHNHDDTSSDEESSSSDDTDLGFTMDTLDQETMAKIAQQFPQLKIDMSIPMEGGFWRKLKKVGSAGIKRYQEVGKEDRAAKKKAKETAATKDSSTASSLVANTLSTPTKTLSSLVANAQASTTKLSSSDPSPSIKASSSSTVNEAALPIGAKELVKQ